MQLAVVGSGNHRPVSFVEFSNRREVSNPQMTTYGFSCLRVLLQMSHCLVPRLLRIPLGDGEQGARIPYRAVETCPARTWHTLNHRARALPGFCVFLLRVALFDPNEEDVLQFSFPALDGAVNN